LSVSELKRILKGRSVQLNRFLIDPEETHFKMKEKHILSKVRLIDNIIKNDPYTKAFLVFQTVSWKIKKTKMPFILIPVRIFDDGSKVVRDGAPFINPVLAEYVDEFEYAINDKSIFSLDSSELAKVITESNGRIIYEMYLTHFKVLYTGQKAKLNKRFVQVENKIDYLEENSDLIPIDFELINIKKAVINGNNTLVNAKQGTKKVALIVNLISEFISRNKSVLYLSEKNYRSLKSSIKDCGLSRFVEDRLDTKYSDKHKNEHSDEISYRELAETVEVLNKYQENFKSVYKGFELSNAFTELILLDELPQKNVEIEFYDELSHKDVENVRNTLTKIQLIINEENYNIPADMHWNDIDVRTSRYKELELVQKIEEIRSLLTEIEAIREMVSDRFGIHVPGSYDESFEFVSNLDFMNSLQYPSSWFVDNNFLNAKKQLNQANTLSGRTMSLYTTINMAYASDITKVDAEYVMKELYGDFFSDNDIKIMNKLLKSKNFSKGELQKLQEEVERLLFYKEEFEGLFKVELGEDFLEFIPGICKLLFDPLLKLSWLNLNKEKKNEIYSVFEDNEKSIVSFIKLRREVRSYFSTDAEDLEKHFITEYLSNLVNNVKRTTESSSLNKIVEQFASNKFIQLNKKKRIIVVEKLLKLIDSNTEINYVHNLLCDLLGIDFDLVDYLSIKELFKGILEFDNPYTLNFNYKIPDIKHKLTEFNTSLHAYKYIIKDSLFKKVKDLSISELEVALDRFKLQSSRLMEMEKFVKNFYLKKPAYLTIQMIKTTLKTVSNFQKSSALLDEHFDEYRVLYGENYVGKETTFKGIRVAVKNFSKFLDVFDNEVRAKEYFEKREYKLVNESLYSLRQKLVSLEDLADDLSKFLVDQIKLTEFKELEYYLSKLSSHKHLVKWVEFIDSLQVLRNFNQLRLAAEINNGMLVHDLVEQFNHALYKKIVDTHYHGFDTKDIVERMSLFNQLNNRVHKQRMSEVGSLRRRKKSVFSNISGIENDKKIYDLVIIDGAERVHSNYMQKVTSMGKTALVIFDDDSTNIDESMLNHLKHQPLYSLEHNYRVSPYLLQGYEVGVLFNQSVEVSSRMDVIEAVVDLLVNTHQKVNVVCFDNRERVEIFNLINTRLMKTTNTNEDLVNRLYVLLYNEYIPSADVTYLLINNDDKKILINAVNTTLKNSKKLIVLDEGDYLSGTIIKEELNQNLMNVFDETLDRLSLFVVNKLNAQLTVRRMISPYDFVIGDGNELICLVKITFNNNTKSDILEETLMLFDGEYEHLTKFIISIDDLYFRQDEILNELREVVENGNR